MGKNRSRVDLVAAVLDAAAGDGTNKTRIMFAARLSYKQLEKYLDIALRLNFLECQGSSYRLTPQGHDFLLRYQSFLELRDAAWKSLEKLGAERARLAGLCMPREPAGLA